MLPFAFKNCPIERTLDSIGRKWAVNIIRDLFLGRKRFSEFLQFNPQLSGKVLSTRLKELQECGLVEKAVIETTPVLVEYGLTGKGRALGEVLYQMAVFSMRFHVDDIYHGNDGYLERDLENLKQIFCAVE
jgi:DNA-binding HxlR family transcriptional regulator